MKKLIIPAALLLVVACAQPFLKENERKITIASDYVPPAPPLQENTHPPYKETFTALNIPEEMKQHFRIEPKASQVIVGESGTMILIPDNAFTDANGNAVKGKVKLEVIEGISNADIMKMNLGTMSDQGVLETGGMVYINAFSETGDTLQLANAKQLDVEIPTDNKKRGMKLWTGITREDGSISWADPQPLKESLVQIPASALEENAAPMKEQAVPKTKDKRVGVLFSDNIPADRIGWQAEDTQWITEVDSNAYQITTATATGFKTETIDLADEKFENTNIATTEFRSRLPFIRQACDARVMLCYTNFPTRALWKSDKAAADTLEKSGCALADVFRQLANLKQDKVNPSDPNTVAALNEAREKALKKYAENVRESQRLSTYSFGMKKLGWANVDCLAYGGQLLFLNAHVNGLNENENVRVTLIVPSRNIFIHAYKRPNGDYSFTHGETEQQAAYPTGTEAFIVARSGRDGNLKFDFKKIVFGQNRVEQLSLHAGTEAALARAMGNEPPKKEEPEKEIDDWYTKAVRSGGGCLCGGETRTFIGVVK
jgi:hypothetical protein